MSRPLPMPPARACTGTHSVVVVLQREHLDGLRRHALNGRGVGTRGSDGGHEGHFELQRRAAQLLAVLQVALVAARDDDHHGDVARGDGSPMFGLPSCTLSTVSHGTLICLMAEAVPSVAQTSKPSDTNFSANRAMAPLLRSFTEMKMVPLLGSRCKAASSALAKAMGSVLSMPITSPVERISR